MNLIEYPVSFFLSLVSSLLAVFSIYEDWNGSAFPLLGVVIWAAPLFVVSVVIRVSGYFFTKNQNCKKYWDIIPWVFLALNMFFLHSPFLYVIFCIAAPMYPIWILMKSYISFKRKLKI